MTASCVVCGEPEGKPHKMSCRPKNREDAGKRARRVTKEEVASTLFDVAAYVDRLEGRISALVADNAAKHAVIARTEMEIQKRMEGGPWSPEGEAHLNALLTIVQSAMLASSPGTALLEELAAKDAAIKALGEAGQFLLGGLVLLETEPKRAAGAIAEASGHMIEALRLAKVLP